MSVEPTPPPPPKKFPNTEKSDNYKYSVTIPTPVSTNSSLDEHSITRLSIMEETADLSRLTQDDEKELLNSIIHLDTETNTAILGTLGKLFGFDIDLIDLPSLKRIKSTVFDNTEDEENHLSTMEQIALLLYSSSVYRLINGFLDNDFINIKEWLSLRDQALNKNNLEKFNYSKIHDPTDLPEKDIRHLNEIKPYIIKICSAITTALKKIKPEFCSIYRGDALTEHELEEMKSGKRTMIHYKKISSWTTDWDKSIDFAKFNKDDYERHNPETNFIHVIYEIVRSEKSKNICSYSNFDEQERLCPPEQSFSIERIEKHKGFELITLMEK